MVSKKVVLIQNIIIFLFACLSIFIVILYLKGNESNNTVVNEKQVELENNGSYIQWRYTDEDGWKTLIATEVLSGKNGTNGTNGKDGINGIDGNDGNDGKDGLNGDYYIDEGEVEDIDLWLDSHMTTGKWKACNDEFYYYLSTYSDSTNTNLRIINQEYWSTEESSMKKYYRVSIVQGEDIRFGVWQSVSQTLTQYVTNDSLYSGYSKKTITSNINTIEFNVSKGNDYEIKIESTMTVNRPNLYVDFYTGSEYLRGNDTNTYYLKNIHKYGYNGSSNINTITTNPYNEFVGMWDFDGTDTWIGRMMYVDAKFSWKGQQPCIYGYVSISDSTLTKCLSYNFYMVGDKDTFSNMNKIRFDFLSGTFGAGSVIEFNKIRSL